MILLRARDIASPPCDRILAQLSDMRLLYGPISDLQARINEGHCHFDIRGLVYTKEGAPALSRNVSCREKKALGVVLEELRIDLSSIRGVQMRVFKLNEVVQTSRFARTRDARERERLRELVLEPGDVVLFTKQQ